MMRPSVVVRRSSASDYQSKTSLPSASRYAGAGSPLGFIRPMGHSRWNYWTPKEIPWRFPSRYSATSSGRRSGGSRAIWQTGKAKESPYGSSSETGASIHSGLKGANRFIDWHGLSQSSPIEGVLPSSIVATRPGNGRWPNEPTRKQPHELVPERHSKRRRLGRPRRFDASIVYSTTP